MTVAETPRFFYATHLDDYAHCPRRYYYDHEMGFGAQLERNAYRQYAGCVRAVLREIAGASATGTPISGNAAAETLAAMWETDGPPDSHPFAPIYREAARETVGRAAERVGMLAGEVLCSSWTVECGGHRVGVSPDLVWKPADGSAPVVEQWRTGKPRTDDVKHPLLALYHRAAAVHFGRDDIAVQVYYTETDECVPADWGKPRGKRETPEAHAAHSRAKRVEEYAEHIAGIVAGAFAPEVGIHCPRCPYYFICGA